MVKQVMDFVLGFVAKMFFGTHQQSTSPVFDLDAVFDRISKIGDTLVERFQKMLVALLMLAGLTVLAVSVLTVRIFQLSADQTVRVLGLFDMDGALFFGVFLAIVAAGLGAWIVKLGRAPIAEQAAQQRPIYTPPPPPRHSPLEEALAAWIHSQIRQQADRSGAEDSRASWNSTPPMSTASGLPDDDIRNHDA